MVAVAGGRTVRGARRVAGAERVKTALGAVRTLRPVKSIP